MARSLAGATQDEVRQHNLASVLQLVHLRGSLSRSEISAATGLNRSTVGALITNLASAGLVFEHQPEDKGVGRPSHVAAITSGRVYVVAADVAVERTEVALVELGGRIRARATIEHLDGETPENVAQSIKVLAKKLQAELPKRAVCVGIGVSIPGVVRHSDGFVQVAPNLEWERIPLGRLVAKKLKTSLNVSVANDADLAALAEHARGASSEFSHIVTIRGDVGVGGGLIIDGRLMSGAGGYGGEVGHMTVDPIGLSCRCGGRGCWETTIGEAAVCSALGLKSPAELVRPIADTPENRTRLEPVGRWFGLGLANIVNILNPEAVVVGGLLGDVLPLTEGVVLDEMGRALAASREQVIVRVAQLGRDAVLIGAAEIAFAGLLDDPLGHLAMISEAG
jgi:predicted NBD/HSP70 family sugar kinase